MKIARAPNTIPSFDDDDNDDDEVKWLYSNGISICNGGRKKQSTKQTQYDFIALSVTLVTLC